MMSDARHAERMISEALDGELRTEELLPLLDELTASDGLRRHYRRARRLQDLLDAGEKVELASPSRRRLRNSGGRKRGTQPGRPSWAALAAVIALLVIGAGVWMADSLYPRPNSQNPQPVAIELRLGENAGQMSEVEFAQMTVELLRADPRYQRKMLDVLWQIYPDPAIGFEDAGQERRFARWIPEQGRPDEERQNLEVAADLY